MSRQESRLSLPKYVIVFGKWDGAPALQHGVPRGNPFRAETAIARPRRSRNDAFSDGPLPEGAAPPRTFQGRILMKTTAPSATATATAPIAAMTSADEDDFPSATHMA